MIFVADADKVPLGFWSGLLLSCISGGAGGTVSALGAVLSAGKGPVPSNPGGAINPPVYKELNGIPWPAYYFARFMIGVGGAMAVMFIALSSSKYSNGLNEVDKLSLVALCFVAGSIGHRLLPLVAAQLERQVGQANQKADEARQKASEADQKANEAVGRAITAQSHSDVNLDVIKAIQYLSQKSDDPATSEKLKKNLEELRAEHPLHRPLNIVLARLYRLKFHDLDRAINVLKEFVGNKESKGQGKEEDTGAALFNIACYYSLQARNASGAAEREKLKGQALDSLAKATAAFSPGKLNFSDPDLDEIREMPQFKSISAAV